MIEPNDVVRVLRNMRELLSPPERWCQGVFAKREDGTGCAITDPFATAWCLRGAADLKTDGDSNLHIAVCDALVDACNGVALVTFNDHGKTTHSQALRAIDRAIIRSGPKVG